MRLRPFVPGLVLAVLGVLARPSAAQAQVLPRFTGTAVPAESVPGDTLPFAKRPWIRPVASVIIPGSGQLLGGQSRGIVYLALEVWVASRAIAVSRRGREQASRYRTLAYDVARRQFTPDRVDGPFEYYESMEKFVESGVYDADPGPGFLPEADPATYNGSVWRLARNTFFVNPDSIPGPQTPAYQQALAFYQAHAVGGQFRWSWRGARLEQDVFRGAIRASDDAFRQRTNYLGALVLNHLASAIDALISVRTGHRSTAVPHLEFGASPDDVALVWTGRF